MPSLVQSSSNTGIAGTTVTVTLGSNTTAGNCLVACVGEINGTTNPTVTGITLGGSAGNWAVAKSQVNNADANAEIWVDKNCTGGQTSVQVTFNAGTGGTVLYLVYVYEFSGVDTASPVDKTNGTNTATSSWSSGATGTLTQASEVVVGVGAEGSGTGSVTMTGPSSPWNNLTQISNTSGTLRMSALSGYQVVSATTTQTYSGTSTGGTFSGAVVVSLKGTSNVTGTGSVALGGLAFSGSGSEKFSGTGHLTLGGLHFSGTNAVQGTGHLTLGGLAFAAAGQRGIVGSGSIALGGLQLHGSGQSRFTGTGHLALGGLAFAAVQTTVVPDIPTEPAGVIAASRDLNKWANAASFFLGSSRGTQPMFFLQAAAPQGLTTSFTAVNYSDSAPVFKDNNRAWSSGNPSRMTVRTPGFYTIAWSVSAASGAAHLQCYAQVTTTASNPFNPSTTLKFQASNRAATTNIVVTSSGGLVPFYLTTGDYIEVYALVGTAQNTSLTFPPQLTGEWVSN